MLLLYDETLIPLPQDDVWLEVSRYRSSLPASAHTNPDCRGHLHQFTGGSWLRQLLVLVDGCLYIYSDIEPDAPAIGESIANINDKTYTRRGQEKGKGDRIM